jgi:sugar lactone lactonase YvrE
MMNYPVGLDIDHDGTVYVADLGNDQIEVFTAAGKPLHAFPDPLEPAGQGSSGAGGRGIAVTDVAVSGGRVFATDSYQVFVFDVRGRLLRQFGKPGIGPSDLDHPNGLDVGPDGTLYVSDTNHARLTAFTVDGAWLWNLGTLPTGSVDRPGSEFGLPRGLTVMDDGQIVVADAFNFDLVRVSRTGAYLGRAGGRGTEPGQFNFPNDVASRGTRLLVADKDNDRVQVVELVRQ